MFKAKNQKLSIITVTKNDLIGLEATYLSLSSQRLTPLDWADIEWVVIDGASLDGTNYFLSAVKFDGDFSYLSEPDSGIFDAMNKGVRLVNGQHVLFLNAGDVLAADDVIKNLTISTADKPNGIISGKVRMHWKQNVSISDLAPWVCHQAVVVPRNILIKYPFDSQKKFFGDLHLWMRLKRDNIFVPHRIDLIVCDFCLGGVGNNPKYLWKRFIERKELCIEFHEQSSRIGRLLQTLFFITVAKIFGNTAYYKTMWFTSNLLQKFRN